MGMRKNKSKKILNIINNINFTKIDKEQVEFIDNMLKDCPKDIISYLKNVKDDYFVYSLSTESKIILAKNGLFHDILVKDISVGVRIEVARLGNYHHILCDDISDDIRKLVAKNGSC